MKKSTQLKIIRFVEKLIGYQHPARAIHHNFKDGEIKLFKFEKSYLNKDIVKLKFIDEQFHVDLLNREIIDHILKTPGVFKTMERKENDRTIIRSSCYFVQFPEENKNQK